jgi:hypothetical protein
VSDPAATFQQIYDRRAWGENGPRSGPGSSPATARPYVDLVLGLVATGSIEHVVDIGCGDWAMWPPHAFESVHYTGIDIVESEVAAVRAAFGNGRRRFVSGDALECSLPDGDLALCKDVLIHLSNDDVARLLARLRRYQKVVICHDIWAPSGPSGWVKRVRNEFAPRVRWRDARAGHFYLVRPIERENSDIRTGGFRPLNLSKHPWRVEDFGFCVAASIDFSAGRSSLPKRIWVLDRVE